MALRFIYTLAPSNLEEGVGQIVGRISKSIAVGLFPGLLQDCIVYVRAYSKTIYDGFIEERSDGGNNAGLLEV